MIGIPGPGIPGRASTTPMINNAKPATSLIATTSLDAGFGDGDASVVHSVTKTHTSMLGRIAIASMASEICVCVSITGPKSAGAAAS